MAAHEHLAAGQFHRREGRPNKTEHFGGGEEEEPTGLPKHPHPKVHKSHARKIHHKRD